MSAYLKLDASSCVANRHERNVMHFTVGCLIIIIARQCVFDVCFILNMSETPGYECEAKMKCE